MSVRGRQIAVAVATALLGVVLAVVLAVLAGRLSTQHIGLAGEGPGAGPALVTSSGPNAVRKPRAPRRPVTTTLPPSPVEGGDGAGVGDD